jgi:hypothetical protein
MSLDPDHRSTRCLAEARQKMRSAAEHLNSDPTVAAVDIIPPTETATGEHAIELTVGPNEHLRPTLLQTIAAHGLEVDTVSLVANRTHRRAILRPR